MRSITITYILIIFLGAGAIASEADSLLAVLEKSEQDSLKVQTLLSLASIYYRTEPDNAIEYGTQAKSLSEAIGYQTGLAYAFKSIGMGYYFKSNYVEALLNWQRSLEVFETINNQDGISNML